MMKQININDGVSNDCRQQTEIIRHHSYSVNSSGHIQSINTDTPVFRIEIAVYCHKNDRSNQYTEDGLQRSAKKNFLAHTCAQRHQYNFTCVELKSAEQIG